MDVLLMVLGVAALLVGYLFARDSMMRIHAEKIKGMRSDAAQVKERFKQSRKKNSELFGQIERLEDRKHILEFDMGLPTSPSRVQRPDDPNGPAKLMGRQLVKATRKSDAEKVDALGDWLVQNGEITLEQLGKAMVKMKETGVDLIQACVALQFIDEQTALEAREKTPDLQPN